MSPLVPKRRKPLSSKLVDRDPKWLKTASEDQLREFTRELDDMAESPRKKELFEAFIRECDRRAADYYEKLNKGEWI